MSKGFKAHYVCSALKPGGWIEWLRLEHRIVDRGDNSQDIIKDWNSALLDQFLGQRRSRKGGDDVFEAAGFEVQRCKTIELPILRVNKDAVDSVVDRLGSWTLLYLRSTLEAIRAHVRLSRVEDGARKVTLPGQDVFEFDAGLSASVLSGICRDLIQGLDDGIDFCVDLHA